MPENEIAKDVKINPILRENKVALLRIFAELLTSINGIINEKISSFATIDFTNPHTMENSMINAHIYKVLRAADFTDAEKL